MQRVSVEQRRARLGRQHRLVDSARAVDVEEVAGAIVCLHATDPATIYLSCWARFDGFATDDLDRAFYQDRSLVKHLAMRRTLFVFDRQTLADAQSGASERVAANESRRLIKDVQKAGLFPDGAKWLAEAKSAVVDALADGTEATSTELRERVPLLEGSVTYGVGKSWGGDVPIGPRVLTVLSAEGKIVRGSNRGDWASSRPRWAAMGSWLGKPLEPSTDGHTAMVERWLRAFGPGTVNDVKWWLGSTVAAVKRSLAELDAVEVDLDGGTGYLLPDDLDPPEPAEPWVALLPALDPTIMGWVDRDWYVDPEYRKLLFDNTGNAGPTLWSDGKVVGGWWQTDAGEVRLHLLEDVGTVASAALESRAATLTQWLHGRKVLPRFPSPLAKQVLG
ncbi:winged helix DNA-binding domain-containing protein [Microlunatus elymi]|uniref:Winged helix DNA-binding domain-containing protein n=1 Tax=Microlunatus elymi TaxID=2596828 RepID=A0A516Q1F5_9ACTN|nr:winged helix DNA-binding domain-containing protein [Microlunatus elymi]QDP97263.1 winged helix DNA-binding domain-containing protein [Microlunatus elymi]